MVLIIRPAALVAAPRFSREELDELADKFTSSDSIHLADILESIMKHTTLEPLYVILSKTNHLLEWGHHFAYYPSKKHTLCLLYTSHSSTVAPSSSFLTIRQVFPHCSSFIPALEPRTKTFSSILSFNSFKAGIQSTLIFLDGEITLFVSV